MLELILVSYIIISVIYHEKLRKVYNGDDFIVPVLLAIAWPYVLIKGLKNI